MMSPQQKFVQCLSPAGFHRTAYLEWGQPDAPRTIVCVHGLTRNAHDFDVLAAALADHARVICIDVIGRGASDNLPDPALYTYQQYLADMAVVLAHCSAETVDWIGTSMGGLIGMLLAAQSKTPIRRLILNDVGPFLSTAAMARIAAYIASPPLFPDMAAAEAYIRKVYQHVGPDTDFAAMTRSSVSQTPDGFWRLRYDPGIVANFTAAVGDIDLWPFYERIGCPTLVLRGAESDVLDAQTAMAMTQRGPRAGLMTIPDVGHYPALADAEQISRVRGFLMPTAR